jgi:hypothetical protein
MEHTSAVATAEPIAMPPTPPVVRVSLPFEVGTLAEEPGVTDVPVSVEVEVEAAPVLIVSSTLNGVVALYTLILKSRRTRLHYFPSRPCCSLYSTPKQL